MNQVIITKLSKRIAQDILKQPNRIIQVDEALISSGLIKLFQSGRFIIIR